MDGGNVLSLAESALACSWRQKKPKVCWLPDHPSYVATLPDNLLSRVELQDFEEDLRNGGGELDWRSDGRSPPKFQAAYSSSALAVNTFSPFRRRMTDLTICNLNGFESLRFEARLPNGAGMPNLDVLCQGSTAVAIESKCVEYLRTGETAEARRHDPDVPFKPAYKDVEHLLDKQFGDLYKLINANFGAFAPVGVAQLVKHYLGIKNTIGDRPAILVYLFWEPSDRDKYPVFAHHRQQVDRLCGLLLGTSVKFIAKSYQQLWQEMARAPAPWVAEHVAELRRRYDVPLKPAA